MQFQEPAQALQNHLVIINYQYLFLIHTYTAKPQRRRKDAKNLKTPQNREKKREDAKTRK